MEAFVEDATIKECQNIKVHTKSNDYIKVYTLPKKTVFVVASYNTS